MFIYEDKLPVEVHITRPNAQYYLLLDHQLQGCKSGLEQALVYIRQSFMIHNEEFHDVYMQLGAKLLNDMEVLSDVIHQMHGEDDRYYDESNDDTPVFEFILPCGEEEKEKPIEHHVNNDLTASVLRDMEFEDARVHQYEQLVEFIQDEGAQKVFCYLKENAQKSLQTLKNLMTILTTHTETKDFGLDGHNAFDLDTSNYFDKPNPTFINPNDIIEIDE
ncbi:manganese catalase family protein [Amedibacillus sp. YH-ame10]